MIRLGLDASAKTGQVCAYVATHSIRKVVAISPRRFAVAFSGCGVQCDAIEWAEVIQYKHFYRLLQEIDRDTLIVLNEPLRTQDRHDLTYNCIRHFLNQTTHQIVFSRLPIIDTFDDFMLLVDFDTRSRWKRESFRRAMLDELDILTTEQQLALRALPVQVDAKTRAAYAAEKRRLIGSIGLGDPHTIPRNLLLMAGRAKLGSIDPVRAYVGRNNRFKIETLETFREASQPGARDIFEFCHGFLEFSDFLAVSGQTQARALVSDLPVDRWYFDRFSAWTRRVADAYAALH